MRYDLDFTVKELCIDPTKPVPIDVVDKLIKYHILPMQKVRDVYGKAIWASQNSGYRPVEWELSHGRNGKSQHTFTGLGATDWTCADLDTLQELILQYTSYTRIARYNSFIHSDYAATDGKRYLFTSDAQSNWTLVKTL